MSKALGILLILGGIGVASTLLPLGSEADAVASAPTPVAEHAGQQPAEMRPAQVVPVVVTLTHSAAPQPSPAPEVAVQTPTDRGTLARALQIELRRVGCYRGEINGIWTPNAQKAMRAFTGHINAALPVDHPDDILLALVRAHRGEGCGESCTTGHGRTGDGRCVPDAPAVQASKQPAARSDAARRHEPTGSGWATVTAAAPPRPAAPPLPGRMALAAPDLDAPTATADPPSRLETIRERGKRARTARRAAKQAKAPRRPGRVFARSSRSRFVESVLYDRRSLN